MAKFPSLRRHWRAVPLGGRLQRRCKFCLTAYDGEAKIASPERFLGAFLAPKGGDRRSCGNKQSDRRSIERSRRHWAQIGGYHGRSA